MMSIVRTLRFILNHPLNRNRRTSALLDWLSWQVGSRLVPGPVVMNFVGKSKLVIKPGMAGATGNLYCGLHEFEDMSFVLHCLREGDTFVDVGANIGSYTVLASAVSKAKTVSIEPIPDTFEALELNIAVNSIGSRVRALNVGVSDGRGSMRFTRNLDSMNHIVSDSDKPCEVVEVDSDTLDNILKNEHPSVLKIDVEGYETAVIAGASDVLNRDSLLCVILETNGSGAKYGFDDKALHGKLLSHGFETFTYYPFERKLVSLNSAMNLFGNTLYARDTARISERLSSAERFSVKGNSV